MRNGVVDGDGSGESETCVRESSVRRNSNAEKIPWGDRDLPLETLTFLLFQTAATASFTSLSPLKEFGNECQLLVLHNTLEIEDAGIRVERKYSLFTEFNDALTGNEAW